MSDEHDAQDELVNLARGIIGEITAVKAAELARQLSRDPGTLALAAPGGVTAPPAYQPDSPALVWHPTLSDPAHRSHLLGHPGNGSHLISGQARPGQHPPPQPAPPPPARRRRRRRWLPGDQEIIFRVPIPPA